MTGVLLLHVLDERCFFCKKYGGRHDAVEIPSPQKERDTQMLSAVHSEPGNKPESMVIATPKDRLIVAGVSLVMLIFLAGMTFGAASILHTGYNGWFAILAVICFAIVTINIVLILSGSHMNRLHEQPPS